MTAEDLGRILGQGARLVEGFVRGLDPAVLGDQVERLARARGDDPVKVWIVVARLAHDRLDALGHGDCACAEAASIPGRRCLACGGRLAAEPLQVVK